MLQSAPICKGSVRPWDGDTLYSLRAAEEAFGIDRRLLSRAVKHELITPTILDDRTIYVSEREMKRFVKSRRGITRWPGSTDQSFKNTTT